MTVWLILQFWENCRQVCLLLWALSRLKVFPHYQLAFSGGKEGQYLATPSCFSWLKKTKYQKRIFFCFSAPNLKDTPYKDNSCAKPCTEFMLNMLCPKVHSCPNPLPSLSKNGLTLAKRWRFTSIIQDTNVILGLKLSTNETNNVICKEKEIKSGLNQFE